MGTPSTYHSYFPLLSQTYHYEDLVTLLGPRHGNTHSLYQDAPEEEVVDQEENFEIMQIQPVKVSFTDTNKRRNCEYLNIETGREFEPRYVNGWKQKGDRRKNLINFNVK
eukprot:TRINITY_DN22543_c0_g1_i1.p1 TRINITY_DN22543_c0_g1~~TRINITY_DN22543_c0_g1_i1.p1  ORF type:complete len:110 (+),score=10.80 TRINITY_DN22543_c0_g1_i1:30-359(+)